MTFLRDKAHTSAFRKAELRRNGVKVHVNNVYHSKTIDCVLVFRDTTFIIISFSPYS